MVILINSDITQVKVKPIFTKPPKPPEVYWSILTKQILDLETKHSQIIRDLTSELSNQEVKNFKQFPSEIASPTDEKQDITWSDLADQLIKLEQQRDNTINYYISFEDKK
ncbi:hypothetical protein [Candidatus Marithrix sp. Canyon 246]|uniref:hypothetical protein n=1 Tax=Candidatus Marithrix sp. Canyon 246 TaxID=1827136 RepID=UPI00114CE563|nr:hypothetical protein [Candidatus Marithrix sp. Canyon 246]